MRFTIRSLDEYIEYISLLKESVLRRIAHLPEYIKEVLTEIIEEAELEMLSSVPTLPKYASVIRNAFMRKLLSFLREYIREEQKYIETIVSVFAEDLLKFGLILDIINEYSYSFPALPDIVFSLLIKRNVISLEELNEIQNQINRYSRSITDEVAFKLLTINYLFTYDQIPRDIIRNAGKYISELYYAHVGVVLKGLTPYNIIRVTIQSVIHLIPFLIRELLTLEDQLLINRLYNLAYRDRNTVKCINLLAKYKVIKTKDKVDLLNLYHYLTRYTRRRRLILLSSNIVKSYIEKRVISIISTLTKRMAVPLISQYRKGVNVRQIEELARDIYTYNILENTMHIIDTNILKLYKLSKTLRVVKIDKQQQFEYPLKGYIPLTVLYDVVKFYVLELRSIKTEMELKTYAQTFDKNYVDKLYLFAYSTRLLSHDIEIAENFINDILKTYRNTTVYSGDRMLNKIRTYYRKVYISKDTTKTI